MADILKNFEILYTALIDLSYEDIVPIYAQASVSHRDVVTGWPESSPLYSCLGEVYSGSKLQGQYLVNTCEYRNRISKLYVPKEYFNK